MTWYAHEGVYSPEQGTYESVLNQTLNRFLNEESQYRGMYYDYMTTLPNMAYFYELAEAGCKRIQEQGKDSAILFFDLTGLKQFNRQYGFAEGDHLIRAVSAVLTRHFSSENCARFAQDHFAAFATEEGLKDRLEAVIAECARINDGKTLPIRIGIYPDRIEAVEIGTACDRARLAADAQKKRKESYYVFFDMDMMKAEKNRQAIIDNLDQAIEEGWIRVYYQPIVRSISSKVCDVEALARWHDPVRGLLSPASFIPVLEEAMLIHKLDLYVVKQVLKDLKSNENAGNKSVPVSVNFSRADFNACDLVQKICTLVDEAQVDRKLINIEITESMVGSDFEYMKEQIGRFRAQGFQVWMDDFGSGYSSLDVLQSIKFDLIKFDMGFMKRLDEGDAGKIILTEMMKMATSLGVDTICEGVETEKQFRFLQEIGCSKLQGYYYMKPVPPELILKKYTADSENGFFIHNYRLMMNGTSVPVYLRATLVQDPDGEKIILGVINDEEEYRRQLEENYKEASSTATIYTHIAQALARGYTDLYYVNMETDELIEFHTDDGHGVLNEIRRGSDFFEGCKRDVKLYVHPDDQAAFVHAMDRDFLTETLSNQKVFELTYRRIKGREPFFVQMRVTRMEDEKRIIVLAVSNIDEQVRQRAAEERIKEERIIYARLHAITGSFICVYVVDPKTGSYREFSAADNYEESFSQKKEGTDFFAALREAARVYSHPDDQKRVLSILTRENVLAEIEHSGIFSLAYRIMMDGRPVHFQLSADMVEEEEGPRLIVGLNNIDAQVRQENDFRKRLTQAQSQANIDALTGVKNKHAYLETEVLLDGRIREHRQEPFAIVIFDVNNLKNVNDTLGHQAGDQYLCDACKIICEIFKRSPVFRVGGDEFAVIAKGSDYDHIDELLEKVNDHNAKAFASDGIVIACGMSKYEDDEYVAEVFERADHNMYLNKNHMKSGSK